MTELKKLSSECEFDNFQDSLIKDMIVCGTKDNSLRERLLRECNLTFSKAISAGHAAEETCNHAREILRSQPTANIYKMFKKKPNKSSHNKRNQNTRDSIKSCKFGDSSHPRSKCPAYGKVHHACNKKNHFKVCCPRVGKKTKKTKKSKWKTPGRSRPMTFDQSH